jgi:hypothetical protein
MGQNRVLFPLAVDDKHTHHTPTPTSHSLPSLLLQTSSRVMRHQRPQATMQLLWTWICPLTEGLPVAGLAWNHQNPDLLAAGYGAKPLQPSKPGTSSSETAAAAAHGGKGQAGAGGDGLGIGAGAGTGGGQQQQQQQRGKVGEGTAASGVASSGGGAGGMVQGGPGRVALWSLKNPNYPLWSFTTDAGKPCRLMQALARQYNVDPMLTQCIVQFMMCHSKVAIGQAPQAVMRTTRWKSR